MDELLRRLERVEEASPSIQAQERLESGVQDCYARSVM